MSGRSDELERFMPEKGLDERCGRLIGGLEEDAVAGSGRESWDS